MLLILMEFETEETTLQLKIEILNKKKFGSRSSLFYISFHSNQLYKLFLTQKKI